MSTENEGSDARIARLERVESAAQRWSEARKEWQLRQTFSTRCALDDAGDELQAVLEGRPVPPKGERAASILGALVGTDDHGH